MPYAVAAGTFTKVVFETSQLEVLVTHLDWLGIVRTDIDADSMDTPPPSPYPFGNSLFIPSGLVDPGEIVLDIHFNPELDMLIDHPPEVITVIWPKGIGGVEAPTWSFLGFVRHIDINGPMDGRISATMTIKLSAEKPVIECNIVSDGLTLCWDMNEKAGNRQDHVVPVPLYPMNNPAVYPSLYTRAIHLQSALKQYVYNPLALDRSYLGEANHQFLYYQPFTILMWIYVDAYPAYLGEVFQQQNSAGLITNGPNTETIFLAQGYYPVWEIILKHTGTIMALWYANGSIGGIASTETGVTDVIPLRQWTLLQLWREILPGPVNNIAPRHFLRFQINNGVILTHGRYGFDSTTVLSQNWFTIGAMGGRSATAPGSASRFFDGKIDRVTMWNRAITTKERQSFWTDFPAWPVLPPGYTGAWSTRLLVPSYGGPLLRVRRASDNAEKDIGAVTGDLDTETLQTFVGASNAYVTTLYDQGGNPQRAFRASVASQQPMLVNAGRLIRPLNGQPTLLFDGVDDTLATTAPMSALIGSGGTVAMIFQLNGKNLSVPGAQMTPIYPWTAANGAMGTCIWTDMSTGLRGISSFSNSAAIGESGAWQGIRVPPDLMVYRISWLHVWRYGGNIVATNLNSPVRFSRAASLPSLAAGIRIEPRFSPTWYQCWYCEMVTYPTSLDVGTLQQLAEAMRQPYGMPFSGLPYMWPND